MTLPPNRPECLLGAKCPCQDIPDSLVQAVLTAWMAQDAPTRPATQPALPASNRPSLALLLQQALAARNSPERDFPPES
jgi:hypothetical protein